jgi:hypothetical protein
MKLAREKSVPAVVAEAAVAVAVAADTDDASRSD